MKNVLLCFLGALAICLAATAVTACDGAEPCHEEAGCGEAGHHEGGGGEAGHHEGGGGEAGHHAGGGGAGH